VTAESDIGPILALPPSPPNSSNAAHFLKLHHILGIIYARFQPWVRHMVCQLIPGCPLQQVTVNPGDAASCCCTMLIPWHQPLQDNIPGTPALPLRKGFAPAPSHKHPPVPVK
jgi:hypothetical protein